MTRLQALAERIAGGAVPTDDDAALLLGSHDLITIGMMADAVRQAMHGSATTFVRVFDVHLDAVPDSLPPGVEAGEIRIVGTPASVDAACAAVRAARALDGTVPLSGFSLPDIAAFHATDPAAYERLEEAGLDAIADVPLDAMSSPADAVAAAVTAGLLVPRLTVHRLDVDPLSIFRQAADLQQATGAFRTFAPLARTMSVAEPTTGYDDVKCVALARVMVRNIPSIQVDWSLYGPKLAQVALTVGADDVDGVAAVEAGTLGRRRSVLEEITRNIRAASLEPVERNGRFERVPPRARVS
jgi:hypothetical protein